MARRQSDTVRGFFDGPCNNYCNQSYNISYIYDKYVYIKLEVLLSIITILLKVLLIAKFDFITDPDHYKS